MATTAVQLYGSVINPKCRTSGAPCVLSLRQPLSSPAFSSGFPVLFRLCGSSRIIPFLQPPLKCLAANTTSTPAFDGNSAVNYTEDQNQELIASNSSIDTGYGNAPVEKEAGLPPKKCAKIHDFCLGIPFGGILFFMGLLGFVFSRSSSSLLLGVAPGASIMALGMISLKIWRSGKSSVPFILAQAAVAAAVTGKFFQAYKMTQKVFPWGFYSVLSVAMICFYSYVLLAGGNPPPKKKLAGVSYSS